MAYCPVCKHQFDDTLKECPTDRTALVDQLPFQTVDSGDVTWVEVASVGSEEEARLLEGFFQAEGIPAQVESLKFNMEPVNLGSMSEIRIYVDSTHESRALELLQSRQDDFAGMDEDDVMTDEGPRDISEEAEAEPERS